MSIRDLFEKILFGKTKAERDEEFIKNWEKTHPEPPDAGRLVICKFSKVCTNHICYSQSVHKKDSFCRTGIEEDSFCYNRELASTLKDEDKINGLPRIACVDV